MEQGLRSATAIVLEQTPNLTYNSAGVTAHRMLNDIKTMPEFAEEKAKIAELQELDEIATSFVRDTTRPDQTRLKALELNYRRKGALIDRTEQTNLTVSNEEMDRRAAEIALRLLKESELVVNTTDGVITGNT